MNTYLRTCGINLGGCIVHMKNDDYRNLIIEMLNELDGEDNRFMIQLYTIIKCHLKKKRRH